MKYQDNKYETVDAMFNLCKPQPQYVTADAGNAKSVLAREIFYTVFIKSYSEFWECIEPKVNISSKISSTFTTFYFLKYDKLLYIYIISNEIVNIFK